MSAHGTDLVVEAACGDRKAVEYSAAPWKRREVIGDAVLYLGDALEVLPRLGAVDHVIADPPYEATLHESKNNLRGRKHRNDGVAELKGLDFDPIDGIRDVVVATVEAACSGWFIAFCTVEGVARWADCINPSDLKYKRACVWVKPDSTPQLNGQCPAQGAEMFVCAWAGAGHSRWNSGGKRGVYTHCVNVGRQGEHPTEKPVPLMQEILADFTQPGELICDPFMGSGTTGVAALQLGRRFVGIEQDPRWFDLACRRIAEAHRQPRLFEEPKPKAEQLNLLGDVA
jgi:site-specific DNA-methyltransferase (adenine-specific)